MNQLTFFNMTQQQPPEFEINRRKMIVIKKDTPKFDLMIFDKIFSQATQHSYMQSGEWWYVVKFNEGYWIHYTMIYSQDNFQIDYVISPSLYTNPIFFNH